jgi:hypothetical protein
MLFYLLNILLAAILAEIMVVVADILSTPSPIWLLMELPQMHALPTQHPTVFAQTPAAPAAFQTRNTTANKDHHLASLEPLTCNSKSKTMVPLRLSSWYMQTFTATGQVSIHTFQVSTMVLTP